MVPPLPGPTDPEALPPQAAAIVVVALVVLLGFVVHAPLTRALGTRSLPREEEVPGAAAALALALSFVGFAVWFVNPYTALLLVPAVHLWLLAAVPEVRLPRPLLLVMILLGFVPFALVGLYYAGQFALDPGELAWSVVVVLAGGAAGPLGVLAWSAILGCGVGAALVAVRKRRVHDGGPGDGPVRIRGPLSYAGPGSLGGTDSALRR
jgi:hypothetical protein